MDWRLVSIPLILLLWIEGGSAQLNCKKANGTNVDWNCTTETFRGYAGKGDKGLCDNDKRLLAYCMTVANLVDGERWVLDTHDHVKSDDSATAKKRTENQCVAKWNGQSIIKATCNTEKCQVDMDILLNECDVGYVKCNNEYIHLNKTMTEIMKDTNQVGPMCLVTFTKSNGTWVRQNVTALLERIPMKNKDMSCDVNEVNNQTAHLKCQRKGTSTGDNCDQQAVSIYQKMSLEEFETKCNIRPFQPKAPQTPQDSGINSIWFAVGGVCVVFVGCGVLFFFLDKGCCCKKTKKPEIGKNQPQPADPEKEMTPEEMLAKQAALKAQRAEAKGKEKYDQDRAEPNVAPKYGGELPLSEFVNMTPEEQTQAVKDGKIYLIAGENASLGGIPSDYGPTATVTKKEEK